MKTINSLRSKLLALTLALMAGVASFAYDEMPPDFKVDGLYYNFLEGDNVEVTHPYRPALPTESASNAATQDSPDDYANLTELTIPSTVTYEGNVYNVIHIGYAAFDQCYNLTYVDIPSSIKTIGVGAFSNCTSLTSITLKEGLEHIEGNAFADCRLLETITFPNSLKTVGSYAFSFTAWYNNQPNGGVYAGNVFYKYKGDIPENTSFVIKEGTVSISPDAFIKENRRIDYGLVAVAIPNSVEIIGKYAFSQCRALRSVNIPSRVTTIESYAFSYCKSLTSVTSEIVEPLSLPSDVFFKASVANATLYVPAESVEAYKNADQWKDFGQILPIEPTSYKSQWCNTWNVMWFDGMRFDETASTSQYRLGKDTIIGDYTYSKFTSRTSVRFTSDRKVYVYYEGFDDNDPYTQDLPTGEYLAYDFSAKVGDTLEVFSGIGTYSTYPCVVYDVETAPSPCVVDDVQADLKTFPLIIKLRPLCEVDGEGNMEISSEEITWIEGVGSPEGFLISSLPCGWVGGGTSALLCAHKGDELKYTGSLYDEYGCEYNATEQNPADLFPTLWGLQRTSCTKTIGEDEEGTVHGLRSTLMKVKQDMIIDGKQYVLFGEGHNYDSFLLREKGNKVFVYSSLLRKDLVLYDYTLEVGDSLPALYIDWQYHDAFHPPLPYNGEVVDYNEDYDGTILPADTFIVTNISTITLLDGKEHKKWTFNNGMQYVEGIGSYGTSYAENDFYQLIANVPQYSDADSTLLVCVSKNNKLLYQMDDTEMERLNTECLCEYNAEQKPEDLFPTLWGLQRTSLTVKMSPTLFSAKTDVRYIKNKAYLDFHGYFLREENNQVLIYSRQLEKDLILYDYSLEVGDTLTTLNFDYRIEGVPLTDLVVDYPIPDPYGSYDPIDTLIVTNILYVTLLDGKEYKQWTFNNGMQYVEGIGQFGQSIWAGDFFALIRKPNGLTWPDTRDYLVCASRNGQLLYQMDDTEMERLGAECLCDYNSGPKKDNAKNGKIGGRPTPTQWNMLEVETKEMDGTPTILRAETFSYTLENDSIVTNNKTFYQLARQSTKDTAITKSFVGAIHFSEDEGNRVYFLCDGEEYVLYDFTAEPGDTLEIFAGINNYPQDSTYTHVVIGKDTIENGACRIILEVIFPEEMNTTATHAEKVWLAGLGSIDGIVHNAAKRTSNVHAAPSRSARNGDTQTSVMLCAWREDSCLYTTNHPDYDTFGCVYNQDPTAVEEVETLGTQYQKILRDGHLYILRDNKLYDVLGTPMN